MTRRRFRPLLEQLEGRLVPAAIPLLSSRPGAPAALYLDFDGHSQSQWSQYSNIGSWPFDLNHNPFALSDSEAQTITDIWKTVAEDFSPFNLNVTTVSPNFFGDYQALRVVIGGNNDWATAEPPNTVGLAKLGSFTNSHPNVVYVFAEEIRDSSAIANKAREIAGTAAHEAGHAFWLRHISAVGIDSVPLMLPVTPPTSSAPYIWSQGTNDLGYFQNDLSILGGTANGFGFRNDDHSNSRSAGTNITSRGGNVVGQGVIEKPTDYDYFTFTGWGEMSFQIRGASPEANVAVRAEVQDANGNVLGFTSGRLPNALSFLPLNVYAPTAGTYHLLVRSEGGHGDVGQYSFTGRVLDGNGPTVVSHSGSVAAGQSLTVTFSEPILASSFTAADLHITRWNGTAWVAWTAPAYVIPIDGTNNRGFAVKANFTPGQYRFILGPDVMDVFGNKMNQNGNGVNGEPVSTDPDGVAYHDAYFGAFTVESPWSLPPLIY